jgi:hypothetical protein
MKKIFPASSPGTDILAQNPPVEGREKRNASRSSQKPKQLNIWESPQSTAPEASLFHRNRPQIVSIPGVSPKEQHRYRVKAGDEVLGDRLTLDEALKLAKGGKHE